ncbi:unnamed protein product [Schistocephalus solidus]|uniref:Uncharacterized protein n=1 Tax=Schistocephalus solidus TaxID=70667 RepID=A0A183SY80_SCHSO|nr:unnamed protein product [Schistocephalus solidus]
MTTRSRLSVPLEAFSASAPAGNGMFEWFHGELETSARAANDPENGSSPSGPIRHPLGSRVGP